MSTSAKHLDRMMRKAAASPRVIGLAGGLPSEVQFPRDDLAASFVRVLRRQGSPALQYGWPEGQPSLRERIAARLAARGAPVSADDVIVTNGAQQAIALAIALAVPKQGTIGIEAASYPAALDLFRAQGHTLASLHDGHAVYVMPAVGNPGGQPLPAASRAAIVARRVPVIEDDAYGELIFDAGGARDAVPPPLLAEAPARTYHVGTFSKTLCPGLRIGWLVPPRARRSRALRLKQNDDLQSNSLAQAVVDDYLAHVDFDARLLVLRRFYRRRAARLAEAVRKQLPSWRFDFPAGGFSLWIETDALVDEARLLERAIAEGVSFDLGSTFMARPEPGAPTRLRLCFSFETPGKFEEGVRRLARAWRWAARSARAA
jgi:2-aminoadipate transaminase